LKIARFDEGRIGIVTGDEIVDVTAACGIDAAEWPPVGPLRLIAGFETLRPALEAALATAPRRKLAEVRLLAPVPWPSKVVAYPVNYHKHGQEMQAAYRATHQGFFLKPPSSISGPHDPVVLPNLPGREIHHECELGIVIGKEARNIRAEDWEDHVFGYTCLMDMVVRGREERVVRKAYDSFCPIGPYVVTRDEVGDPSNLRGQLWVNDELRQDANTRDLVLDIPGMIQTAAAVMTLHPGDIIATGTPEGVGIIRAGDRVRIEFERVGEMTVDVVAGTGGYTQVFEKPYIPEIIKAV